MATGRRVSSAIAVLKGSEGAAGIGAAGSSGLRGRAVKVLLVLSKPKVSTASASSPALTVSRGKGLAAVAALCLRPPARIGCCLSFRAGQTPSQTKGKLAVGRACLLAAAEGQAILSSLTLGICCLTATCGTNTGLSPSLGEGPREI